MGLYHSTLAARALCTLSYVIKREFYEHIDLHNKSLHWYTVTLVHLTKDRLASCLEFFFQKTFQVSVIVPLQPDVELHHWPPQLSDLIFFY